MKAENPGAMRFFLQDDIYLLNADKTLPDTPPAKSVTETPEKKLNYSGKYKKRFLIIVHYPDQEFIHEAHLTALENILQQMSGFSSIKKHNNFLQLLYSNGNADAAAINQYCFQHNIALNHLQVKKKSLETKFLELTNKV